MLGSAGATRSPEPSHHPNQECLPPHLLRKANPSTGRAYHATRSPSYGSTAWNCHWLCPPGQSPPAFLMWPGRLGWAKGRPLVSIKWLTWPLWTHEVVGFHPWIKAFDIWHPSEAVFSGNSILFLTLCSLHFLSGSMNHLTWSDCSGDEMSKPTNSKSCQRDTCRRMQNPEGGPPGSQSPGDRRPRCSAVFPLEESHVHSRRHPWPLHKTEHQGRIKAG